MTVNAEFSVAPQTAVVFEFDALWHVPVSNTVEKNIVNYLPMWFEVRGSNPTLCEINFKFQTFLQ